MARGFPGSTNTDNIHVTEHSPINLSSSWSWAAWVNITALDATVRRVFDKFNNTAGVSLGYAAVTSSVFQVVVAIWNGASGTWTCPISALTTGIWQHLAVTYNAGSVSNTPTMYINGVSQTVTQTATPSGSLGTDVQDLYFGNNSGLDRCFNGSMAEQALWDIVLTGAQVSSLASGVWPMGLGTGANVPEGYWPLCGYASPEPDFSGNANNGVVTGTTSTTGPTGVQTPCNCLGETDGPVIQFPTCPEPSVTVW